MFKKTKNKQKAHLWETTSWDTNSNNNGNFTWIENDKAYPIIFAKTLFYTEKKIWQILLRFKKNLAYLVFSLFSFIKRRNKANHLINI